MIRRTLGQRAVALLLLVLCGSLAVDNLRAQDSPAQKSDAFLAERLRAIEEANRRLTEQLEQTNTALTELRSQMNLANQQSSTQGTSANDASLPGAAAETQDRTYTLDSPVPDYTEDAFSASSLPRFPAPSILTPGRVPLVASFGPGFQVRSKNKEFSLQIHYESQIEARQWSQGDQLPANSGFFLPRQRIFFDGTITKDVEYELSINRGLGGINVLNAYLNFHFDDRLEFRIGRFFTPFTYDQYAVSNYWLLTPERSVFTTNLSPNRQFGAMLWGYLFDKQLDYALGVFNGSRNSFEDPDNNRDVVGFVNFRPFQESDSLPWLRFLNLGTSAAFGRQNQSPSPVTFRVAGGSPDTNIPGNATTPFLILNSDVNEQGDRLVGSVHAAYFYKSLSLIGEWQYGYGHYAAGRNSPVRVPFSGYYVGAGYFLTGEEIERRTRLKPLRSVFPTDDGERGCGAWELTGRVARLSLGEEVFANNLADRAVWSNSVTTTEVGLNWYLNEYLKVYMFWLHADFGEPVRFRPDRLQKRVDMAWLRCQLYF